MSESRFTAQEMREMAFKVQPAPNMPDREYKRRSKVEAMLHQAADDKARLEAVVKECEAIKSHYEKVVLSQLPITLVIEANRILCAARGEGGAK